MTHALCSRNANTPGNQAEIHREMDKGGTQADVVRGALTHYVSWAKIDAGQKESATHQTLLLAKVSVGQCRRCADHIPPTAHAACLPLQDMVFVAMHCDCIAHGHGLGIITAMTASLSINSKNKLGVGSLDNLEAAHSDTKRVRRQPPPPPPPLLLFSGLCVPLPAC